MTVRLQHTMEEAVSWLNQRYSYGSYERLLHGLKKKPHHIHSVAFGHSELKHTYGIEEDSLFFHAEKEATLWISDRATDALESYFADRDFSPERAHDWCCLFILHEIHHTIDAAGSRDFKSISDWLYRKLDQSADMYAVATLSLLKAVDGGVDNRYLYLEDLSKLCLESSHAFAKLESNNAGKSLGTDRFERNLFWAFQTLRFHALDATLQVQREYVNAKVELHVQQFEAITGELTAEEYEKQFKENGFTAEFTIEGVREGAFTVTAVNESERMAILDAVFHGNVGPWQGIGRLCPDEEDVAPPGPKVKIDRAGALWRMALNLLKGFEQREGPVAMLLGKAYEELLSGRIPQEWSTEEMRSNAQPVVEELTAGHPDDAFGILLQHNLAKAADLKLINDVGNQLNCIGTTMFGELVERMKQMISEEHLFLEMRSNWSSIVGRATPLINEQRKLGKSSKEVLNYVYTQANILWTTLQTDNFTESHFEHRFWQGVFGLAQSSEKQEQWNHLHKANEGIASQVARHLKRANKRSYRVVEGGVGYANTAYMVLRELTTDATEEALGRKTGKDLDDAFNDLERPDVPSVRYEGYELNHWYINQSNLILNGRGANGTEVSSRDAYFKKLCGDRLSPLRRDSIDLNGSSHSLVKRLSMDSGVRQLLASEDAITGTVDLFMTSYAWHHLPNSNRLIRYLAGVDPESWETVPPELPSPQLAPPDSLSYGHHATLMAESPALREAFAAKLSDALEEVVQRRNAGKPPREDYGLKDKAGVLAKVVMYQLPLPRPPEPGNLDGQHSNHDENFGALDLTDVEIERIRAEVEQLRAPDLPTWKPQALLSSLIDRQKLLVYDVFRLLRPGGLIVIADPDGFSNFNRDNLEATPEMGVAYFRTRESCVRLLKRAGYQVLAHVRQAKSKDGHFTTAAKEVDVDMGWDDPNLGYVVIAQKPESSLEFGTNRGMDG